MSWLSSLLSGALERFKRRMRDRCRDPNAVAEILLYPPLAACLAKQQPEVRLAVIEALGMALDYIADKWFGG